MSDQPHPQTAVVFGASGAIGRAITARLIGSGAYQSVHAGSRSGAGLPAGCVPFAFDLDDESSIAAAIAALPAPPDLAVVATGLLHDTARAIAPEKSLRALDPAAMAALYAANAIGPALIAKHLIQHLPRSSTARIGILSARVGSIGDNRLGGWHGYRASKAALNMLIRGAAIELARTHPAALITALHPGTVDSALSAPFQRGVAAEKLFTPDQAAAHLLAVLDALSQADSGGLFAWDGQRLPD